MKIFKTLVHVICVSLILHFPLMTYAQTPINKKMNSGLELDVKSAMQLASQIINTVPSVQVFLKLVEPAIGEKSVEILKNHLLGLQLDLSKPFLKTELQADGSVLVGDQKDQLKLMPNLEVQLGAQKAKWRSVQSRGLQENLKSLTEFLKSDLKGHKQSFYRAMPRFLLGEKAQALTLSKSDIKYGSSTAVLLGVGITAAALLAPGTLPLFFVSGLLAVGVSAMVIGLLIMCITMSYGKDIIKEIALGKVKISIQNGEVVLSVNNVKLEPTKSDGVEIVKIKAKLFDYSFSELQEAAKKFPSLLNDNKAKAPVNLAPASETAPKAQ